MPEGGNNGATLGQQRLNLFNFAAGIWGAFLDSNVTTSVRSNFDPLTPCSPSGGVLGSAGTNFILRDFPNAQFTGTWYHQALANKQAGSDQIPAEPEINTTFNSSVDTGCLGVGTRFYYGLNNSTPSGTINLLVVLLHEFGHGLGFSSFVNPSTGAFPGNPTPFPDIYSRFMFDRSVNLFWNQMTNPQRVTSAVNPGNVLWDGANVRIGSSFLTAGREAATGRVQLFTPGSLQLGSSVSHWDTVCTPNLLMEPSINIGLPIDLDLTRQQTRDIGWYRDTTADLVPDTITNVQPNSGSVAIGSNFNLSWTNNGGFNRNVTLELSTDGGATFPVAIATDVNNTGARSWTVPNNPTTQARIRVREHNFAAPAGVSSANFTISGGGGCTLTCPSNITTNTAPGQCNAVVTYPPPTTTGTCGTVTCTPPSGATFQKGTTTVNCSSSAGGGSCSFTVTVNDAQSPSITCPANVSVTSSTPTPVTYSAPTVSDNCPGVGAPGCTPPSGSTFPLGSTIVSCNVSDASGNPNSCSFTVTVTPPGGNELSVDDGSFESVIGLTNGGTQSYVNRLTPASYPATVSGLKIFFANFGNLSLGTSISLLVGNNADGDTNINNTLFQTTPATVQALNQFNTYDVPDVTIASGDLVVGFRITYPAGVLPCAQDRTPPSQQRSYISTDAAGTTFIVVDTIGPDFTSNFGIRALLQTTPTALQYYPLPRPIRLFDTRATIPGFAACEYLNQPLITGQEFVRQAAGITCDGITISANARAIVGNATVVSPVGAGFATLWPDGQPRPPVSNLNYTAGQIVANAFTVGLGANGRFRIYSSASTHFIVDVTGYFAPPGTGGLFYHPLPRPIRLFDTRAPIPGFAACAYLNQPLLADAELARQARITCDEITIPADATAIVGNATVTGATSSGFITLFPDGQPRPPVSNLNYVTGQTVPNAFTVGLGANGMFRTYALAGTHFIVDVTGYYSPSPSDANGTGLLYNSLPRPIRLFDTRAPIPEFAACEYLNQLLLADAELAKQARITCEGITIPAAAQAIVGNATVTGALGNGFITLFPNGQPRPPVSNLNYVTGQTVPNAFTVGLGADGQFRIYSLAGTHFITDVTGFFAP